VVEQKLKVPVVLSSLEITTKQMPKLFVVVSFSGF
jgi:hypothetical protein